MSVIDKEVIEGQNTQMANEMGIGKKFGQYIRLSSANDFVKKSYGLMSIGVAQGREIISIDASDEAKIISEWTQFYSKNDQIDGNEVPSLLQVMTLILKFTKSCFSNTGKDFSKQIDDLVKDYLANNPNSTVDIMKNEDPDVNQDDIVANSDKDLKKKKDLVLKNVPESDKHVVVPLRRFFESKIGICRHKVLVNCMVLAHLVKTGSPFFKPEDSVRQHRGQTKLGGHASVTYISHDKIYILDDNFLFPFYLLDKNQLIDPAYKTDIYKVCTNRFIAKYGDEYYNDLWKKLTPVLHKVQEKANDRMMKEKSSNMTSYQKSNADKKPLAQSSGSAAAPPAASAAAAEPKPSHVNQAAAAINPQEALRVVFGDEDDKADMDVVLNPVSAVGEKGWDLPPAPQYVDAAPANSASALTTSYNNAKKPGTSTIPNETAISNKKGVISLK